MYSYDCTLVQQKVIADADFASAGTVVLPCVASADLGLDPVKTRQPRVLANARVLGISGVVGTAGTGIIKIGDGTTDDRYGTITLDETVTAGNSIVGTIVLTDEGCHMGTANDDAATTAFTLTFSGTAVIDGDLVITYGHW